MRRMMLDQCETGIGKPVPNGCIKALRKRTYKSNTVYIARLNSGRCQASLQGVFGQVAFRITTCDLSLFRRRRDSAVAQYRRGRIAVRTANSDNDHELLSALLDLGPGISKADRTVEHQAVRRRVPVSAEVTQTLKLIPFSDSSPAEARLNLTALQYFE